MNLTKPTNTTAAPSGSKTEVQCGSLPDNGKKFVHPKPVFEIPKLGIDILLYSNRRMPVHGKVERRIVFNLVKYLEANGFTVPCVYDGEEFTRTKNVVDLMEICFNLDEVSLRVRSATAPQSLKPRTEYVEHGIWLIFGNGNNGVDVISDYTYAEGDPDNFQAIMGEFDAEVFA